MNKKIIIFLLLVFISSILFICFRFVGGDRKMNGASPDTEFLNGAEETLQNTDFKPRLADNRQYSLIVRKNTADTRGGDEQPKHENIEQEPQGLPSRGIETTGKTSSEESVSTGPASNSKKIEPADTDPEKHFNFVKLDFYGKSLPDDSEEWSCVLDKGTGLIWEAKTKWPGKHFALDRYRWGSIASENVKAASDKQCSYFLNANPREADVDKNCNLGSIVAVTNMERLCSFDGWRVPSLRELGTIVNINHKNPSIDARYFPNTQLGYYWTSEPSAYDELSSWAITFVGGVSNDQKKSTNHYVRLVGTLK